MKIASDGDNILSFFSSNGPYCYHTKNQTSTFDNFSHILNPIGRLNPVGAQPPAGRHAVLTAELSSRRDALEILILRYLILLS